jgi:hypothetical protein
LPRPRSAGELQRVIALDRVGGPYVLYRDGGDVQVEVAPASRTRLTIGRDPGNDVPLGWDARVSRLHAELERHGESWILRDDGISTNGTSVNGDRVRSRRLRHGDVLQVGRTVIVYRDPGEASVGGTVPADDSILVSVTPAQRRVLLELCRPFVSDPVHAFPPTNAEIAAALVVSERAVKSQMRTLFRTFGIESLPQNAKRARLAEMALAAAVVSTTDYRDS